MRFVREPRLPHPPASSKRIFLRSEGPAWDYARIRAPGPLCSAIESDSCVFFAILTKIIVSFWRAWDDSSGKSLLG